MEDAEAQFLHIFRRPPTPDDNLFPGSYITSVADDREQLDRTLQEIGIDPARRYATWKTGLIPVEGRDAFLSDSEIAAWEDAVDEFLAATENPSASSANERDRLLDKLDPEILRLPYVFGMFLHECPPHVWRRPDSEDPYLAGSVFFYATKALKTFEAVQTLTRYNLGEDALSLVRGLYEDYLHIIFALRDPARHGAWTKARIGLDRGTHVFRTSKQGRPDRRIIVEVASGEETEAAVSSWTMANTSPFNADLEVHDSLYHRLSDFTHPNPRTIGHYLSSHGWDVRRRDSILPADVYGFGIALVTLDAANHLSALPRRPQRDVIVYLRHARRALCEYLRYEIDEGVLEEEFEPLLRRAQVINRTWAGKGLS